ncbi:MAG: helicase-associated domain-containing protein [Deltaproteobacteria bacterium]|nr:helicase-associated domain-containing protein [Deltaproteobacteria bacterium]
MIAGWSDGALRSRGVESPAAHIGKLPPARRRRLAERVGSAHTDATSLSEALSRPESARALLPLLGPAALRAASLFVEALEPIPTDVVLAEAERRGQADDLALGLEALESEGLLLRTSWSGGAEVMMLTPPLSRTLHPYLWMLEHCRPPSSLAVTSPARRASVRLQSLRELTLALAATAVDAPRIPKEGGVHGADVARIAEERFPAGTDAKQLAAQVAQLLAMGLIAGQGGRARVLWPRVDAFFELSAGARLPLLLATDLEPAEAETFEAVPGLAERREVRTLLAAALARLPAGTWVRGDALEAAVRLRLPATDAATPYREGAATLERTAAIVRQELATIADCLEGFGREGQSPTHWRLPRGEEGEPDALWIVQPTHEIFVPPEVPPVALASLSALATLQRADVMATFRVEPGSIARAHEAGLDADEILDRIALGAEHDPPDTLAVQIEDWLTRAEREGVDEERESSRQREVPAHLQRLPPAIPEEPALAYPPKVQALRDQLLARLRPEDEA